MMASKITAVVLPVRLNVAFAPVEVTGTAVLTVFAASRTCRADTFMGGAAIDGPETAKMPLLLLNERKSLNAGGVPELDFAKMAMAMIVNASSPKTVSRVVSNTLRATLNRLIFPLSLSQVPHTPMS